MTMNITPPAFATIGSAQIVAYVNIVTLKCCCVNHTILTGQMGIPIVCHSCKKVWFVSATSQIKVQEVLADLSEKPTSMFDTIKS